MGRSKYYIGISKGEAGNMTKREKKNLFDWVASGNSPLDNPWHMCHEDNRPYDFISATRVADEMAAGVEGGIEDIYDGFPDALETELPF
jgi:hypothetical protein